MKTKGAYNSTISEIQIENDKLLSQIEAFKLSLIKKNFETSDQEIEKLEKKIKHYGTMESSSDFVYNDFEMVGNTEKNCNNVVCKGFEVLQSVNRKVKNDSKQPNDKDSQKLISDQYALIFYLISKIKEQNIKQQPSQYVCNSLHIPTIQKLFSEHGCVYEELIPNISNSYKVVSFIGDINSGKTHIINEIFHLNLVETPTQSLNIIQPKNDDSLLIIDTPGLNKNCESVEMPLQQINEIEQIDYIIKSIAIYKASIVFYISNSFTYKTQKEIEKIQSMFTSSQNNSMTDLFVLINCPFIFNEEQYKKYVENAFNKYKFQEKGNLFFQKDMSNEQKASLSCLTIYAVFCPYLINDIFSKINTFINFSNTVNISNITDEIILNSLKTTIVELFDVDKENVKCEMISQNKKMIKFTQNNQKQKTQQIKQKQIVKTIQPKSKNYIGDLSYWKIFEPFNVTYSYYLKDEKVLYIQIKCPLINSIKIKYKGVKQTEHRFEFILQSTIHNKELNESKISYSNRKNRSIVLNINVPSSWGDISSNQKCSQLKYKKGLFLIGYPVQQIVDSITE